jgi:type IX secretion system PorP/SprF family membrane protein
MRHFLLVVIAIGSSLIAKAQDPLTSHTMGTYTDLNPSMMGKDSSNLTYLNHRNQWPNIQGGYVTTRFGYHHYLSRINGYVGLSLMQDNAGDGTLRTTNLSLNYAQNIKINKVLIKVGAKTSYYQKVLDWDKLTFGDEIDQQVGFINQGPNTRRGMQPQQYLDFSAGSSIYWKGFTAGAALFHALEPSNGFITTVSSKHPMTLSLQFSKTFSKKIKDRDFLISPFIYYSKQQDFRTGIFGILSSYHWAILGVSYRNEDALIYTAGVRTKYINVVYSYDQTISKLYDNTGGSHEISLQFHPFKKRKKAHENLISVKSPFML